MSPKDQATAARLLADWLAKFDELKAASNSGDTGRMFELLEELDATRDRTELWVNHNGEGN